jgi:hypothetical protein
MQRIVAIAITASLLSGCATPVMTQECRVRLDALQRQLDQANATVDSAKQVAQKDPTPGNFAEVAAAAADVAAATADLETGQQECGVAP